MCCIRWLILGSDSDPHVRAIRRDETGGLASLCVDDLLAVSRYAFLLMVVLVFLFKSFYLVHFQRAIVLVQARVGLDVMSLMLSYCFRVLDAVSLFVLVIFQHVVIAVFSNIARHIRLCDAV